MLNSTTARLQSEQLIASVPAKIRHESYGFHTRVVSLTLKRDHYSKENLERLWRFYCEKYPDKEDKLDIRVYVDRGSTDPGSEEDRGFDANFNRQGEGAAGGGGDNEFYSYRPDLAKPNETVNVQLKGRYPFLRDSYSGDSGFDFVLAAWKQDVTRLEEFLKSGGNVNVVDDKGRTALMSACRAGNIEIVRMLLAKGANPNLNDKEGSTALFSAAMWSEPDPADKTRYRHGNIEIVRLLLANGADPKEDKGSFPVLVVAAEKDGSDEIVKLLLEKGADVNVKSWSGMTALSRAVYDGKVDTAKILLARGADIESRDRSGNTPLILAATQNRDVVRTLLVKGADANATNDRGETALMLVYSIDSVVALMDYGAELNSTDKRGMTALMHAVGSRNLEKAKVLVEKGAHVNARNLTGKTALAIAKHYSNNRAIIELLQKFGATV
jgi:hypothetical protein